MYENFTGMLRGLDVIDFHTHPFAIAEQNICSHKENCDMTPATTLRDLGALGMRAICGSVVSDPKTFDSTRWESFRALNDTALALAEEYDGFYIPGFHVHPDFVRESCEEIERMAKKGVHLIGELVPYFHNWRDYSRRDFSQILDVAEQYDMIVSFHSMGEDEMDKMVLEHPRLRFVAAHPGEYGEFTRHMQRMRTSDSYYLDTSGYGIFRHGMLRHAIDLFGKERFLYGSDFPTCNPAMYLGGVLLDYTLTDTEKEYILSRNAKTLLGL